jgi:hypothetical protein
MLIAIAASSSAIVIIIVLVVILIATSSSDIASIITFVVILIAVATSSSDIVIILVVILIAKVLGVFVVSEAIVVFLSINLAVVDLINAMVVNLTAVLSDLAGGVAFVVSILNADRALSGRFELGVTDKRLGLRHRLARCILDGVVAVDLRTCELRLAGNRSFLVVAATAHPRIDVAIAPQPARTSVPIPAPAALAAVDCTRIASRKLTRALFVPQEITQPRSSLTDLFQRLHRAMDIASRHFQHDPELAAVSGAQLDRSSLAVRDQRRLQAQRQRHHLIRHQR